MMDLKFRVWEKEKKKMRYLNNERIYDDLDKQGYVTFGDVLESTEDRIVMQFTGLKDKLGNDIYEGDIVKNFYREEIYIIEWDEEITGFTQRKKDTYMHFFMDWSKEKETKYNLEIIGNVHENSDLLVVE